MADDLKAPTAEESVIDKCRLFVRAADAGDFDAVLRVTLEDDYTLASTLLALHARVAELIERKDTACQHVQDMQEERDRFLRLYDAERARATTAEATLARYREALEGVRDLLKTGPNILNEARAWSVANAALLPSPAAETEGSKR